MRENLLSNYIHGQWRSPKTSPVIEIRNPADVNEVIGSVVCANATLAHQAVEAAGKAWSIWKKIPCAERTRLLDSVLQRIRERREDLASVITRETGKTLREALAEIEASLKEGQFQLDFFNHSLSETIVGHEVRYEPLGVALLITPWNFPLATVLRKLIPALATGNTAVVKASEFAPVMAVMLFQLIDAVPLPPGVVNLVQGAGVEIGPALLAHPALQAVSFTGSTKGGSAIAKQLAGRNIHFQAEMGGKNATVVLADAELEDAVEAVTNSAFACSGQWCTGTSCVIVDHSVYPEFLDLLISRGKKITVGPGMEEGVTMGPLISGERLEKVEAAVAIAKREGARLVLGGKRPDAPELTSGYFFQPTIFADVNPQMTLAQEEVFGPVLAILPASGWEEAVAFANASRYGLAFSVFTQDPGRAEHFIQEVEAGVCHINLPTTYRQPDLPLLGWKESGSGQPECGRHARDFFTRTKSIYRKES